MNPKKITEKIKTLRNQIEHNEGKLERTKDADKIQYLEREIGIWQREISRLENLLEDDFDEFEYRKRSKKEKKRLRQAFDDWA
jgi:predicted  nucleic acid-binding Zn-ribbon protein